MLNSVTSPVRAMLLATMLAFALHAVDARATAQTQTVVATATTARTKTDEAATSSEEVPLGGVLIIIGIIGGLILLAWIGSRISDNRPSMS